MQDQIQIPWPEWTIVKRIGTGGFGAVYEIERDVFGVTERAAMKVITIPKGENEIADMKAQNYTKEQITTHFHSRLEKIVGEYSTMVRIKGHPNVVYCDDVKYIQHEDGIGWDIYIKMELLIPLMSCLDRFENEPAVIDLGISMCSALVLCREQNIVHRDIKPQNIFVSKDGVCKLGDFGIARTMERTTSGSQSGTRSYMAPEVYMGQRYGASVDQYSLGLVLYWLLNDYRTPFLPKSPTYEDWESSYVRRFDGEPIPPPAHGSRALQAIVLNACAYHPRDRFPSAAEMLRALQALRSGSPIPFSAPIPMGAASRTGPGEGPAADPSAVTVNPRTVRLRQQPSPGGDTVGAIGAGRDRNAPPVGPAGPAPGKQAPAKPAAAAPVGQTAPKEKKKRRGLVPWLAAGAGLAAVIGLVLLLTLGRGGPSSEPEAALQSSDTEALLQGSETDSAPPSPGPGAEASAPETREALPRQLDWSEWAEALPAYVTEKNYAVEERTLYSIRSLETTSSTTGSTMDGWELYNTAVGNGDYGAWSDWSQTRVTGSDTREVRTETRYHYSDKETTTGSSSTLSGWTLEDTTYSWGEYGNWSAWSTDKVSSSDSREVQSETRYRYSDKETTTSSSSTLSGWTQYDVTTSWGEYGSWSSWQTDSVSANDSRQVETKTQYRYRDVSYTTQYTSWGSWSSWQNSYVAANDLTNVETRTGYYYYFYLCPNCGAHMHVHGTCYTWAGGCGYSGSNFNYGCIHEFYSAVSYSNTSDWHGTGRKYTDSTEYGRAFIFYPDSPYYVSPITQYRYRTRSTYQEASYGSWSSWGDTAYSSSSTREVQTQTVYRYRTRSQVSTYYYYRWKDWSSWSTTAVTATDNRQVESRLYYRYHDRSSVPTYHFYRWKAWSAWSVAAVSESGSRKVETTTFYQYRDKVTQTTYYFRRWTAWSDYTESPAEPSDTLEVQTKTQYRYKSRNVLSN